MSVATGLVARTSSARYTSLRSAGSRAGTGQLLRRPALAVVPPGRDRIGRTPFVAVVVSLLAVGLLGLLVLNTFLAQDAFRLHTLKAEGRTLEDREQLLQREVEALRAPQALAERAAALGMVPAGPPAFLSLPDGAVLGAETPAEVPELAPEETVTETGSETGSETDSETDAAPAESGSTDSSADEEPVEDDR